MADRIIRRTMTHAGLSAGSVTCETALEVGAAAALVSATDWTLEAEAEVAAGASTLTVESTGGADTTEGAESTGAVTTESGFHPCSGL
jgi:hypothetical protein